ncbi:cytosine deaminase [Pontivivens insulae]|uniref:Pterin deaminase n=1 Tax=Pontivivens insulae TaxID=1639689 RepID=A0A2R8A8A9_9RHOB|nr:cytosine deaminase [Pontivivens insulae]RED18372.1 cytosine deaminase [Pontivivens insulae]SPF28270.1 Pterin deaminase [Pontivivens insulae]
MTFPTAKELPTDGPYTLANLRVPAALIGKPGDLADLNITVEGEHIVARPGAVTFDMKGAIVLPAFADIHTHLDKGHILPRASNPHGTLSGAMRATAQDRDNWTHIDLWRRMNFALESAFVHGTRAIRTHLDSRPEHASRVWPLFLELREEWADRITLQAATLLPLEATDPTGPFRLTADMVAHAGGVLGALALPSPELPEQLDAFLSLARQHDLAVDFHADETDNPQSDCLRHIAEAVLRTGFEGAVTVGHCCSLATQSEEVAQATLERVAEAGIGVVCLPLANAYLQDHMPGRTPRWRGITLVHEMQAMGIPVAFASDNTRDPFNPHGDLDMVEIMRASARLAHLDLGDGEWPLSFTTLPTEMASFEPTGFLPGQKADFILFSARDWSEFLSRPQSDRLVIRAGRPVAEGLPDYSALDDLMDVAD